MEAVQQILLLKMLLRKALMRAHYPQLTGHPGESGMYRNRDGLSTGDQWLLTPTTLFDIFIHVGVRGPIKERTRPTFRYFLLNARSSTFQLTCWARCRRIPTVTGYLLCIADRYSEMVRTFPLRKPTAAIVAKVFWEQWLFPYGTRPISFPKRAAIHR